MSFMTTTHDYRGYVFIITYAPEDPAYVVDFSDIPDIMTSGQTLPKAFHHACEALDLHLESLQNWGFHFRRGSIGYLLSPLLEVLCLGTTHGLTRTGTPR